MKKRYTEEQIINTTKQHKTGVKASRFGTLMAICRELDCQSGDILVYMSDDEAKD